MPSENSQAHWILIMNIKQISSLFFLAGFSLTVHSEPATLEYAPRGEWLRIANEICRYYHQGQRREQCWLSFNTLLQERQECEESYHDTPWRCTSHFDGLMWRWELDERKDSKQSSVSTQPVTTNRARCPCRSFPSACDLRAARKSQIHGQPRYSVPSSCQCRTTA